jgi:hypothetical protein
LETYHLARARRDARRFKEERELEKFGSSRDGLCRAECFSLLIRSTPLPKGIKLSDSIVKFNGQQDPRIWLDDFITAVTIGGGSRDNALQLLSLHLKDNARAWLNNLAPDSIRSWEEFRQALEGQTFEVPRDGPCRSKNCGCAFKEPEKT